MRFLYNIFVYLMVFGMNIFALFDAKTKKGIRGRKLSLKTVREKLGEQKVIWVHAASLGEYEQGLPVLEKLKKLHPEYKTLVTFFSPSGYENVRKRKQIADVICYLPFDKPGEIKAFVSSFQPQIFFTVKYDYWYNLLAELRKSGCRNYVISALFYENQFYFKFYGKWFVEQLRQNIDWFFHQTVKSSALAKSIGLVNSSVSGDTRFDRVKQFLEKDKHLDFIDEFKEDKKLVVFGSSWEAEEDIAQILSKKLPDAKLAIAPHDLQRVPHLQKLFPNAVLYSQLEKNNQLSFINCHILIIDSIGKLTKLYAYADLAIVGGGFHSAGLHNILEAAVYGVPVIFGNRYKKNPEADALIAANGARCFDDFVAASAFAEEVLKDDNVLKKMAENAKQFVISQPDSTEIIIAKMSSCECENQMLSDQIS